MPVEGRHTLRPATGIGEGRVEVEQVAEGPDGVQVGFDEDGHRGSAAVEVVLQELDVLLRLGATGHEVLECKGGVEAHSGDGGQDRDHDGAAQDGQGTAHHGVRHPRKDRSGARDRLGHRSDRQAPALRMFLRSSTNRAAGTKVVITIQPERTPVPATSPKSATGSNLLVRLVRILTAVAPAASITGTPENRIASPTASRGEPSPMGPQDQRLPVAPGDLQRIVHAETDQQHRTRTIMMFSGSTRPAPPGDNHAWAPNVHTMVRRSPRIAGATSDPAR